MTLTLEEHGKARAGKITGSVAQIISSGSTKAWTTLAKKLWADDGTKFAEVKSGPRAFGHAQEAAGAGKFWERHPEYEMSNPLYVDYTGPVELYRVLVGCSPDRLLHYDDAIVAGLEVKSPTRIDCIGAHITPYGCPPHRNPHYAQIQHCMFVTGLRKWYLIVHCADKVVEEIYTPDPVWLERYCIRLTAFISFYDSNRNAQSRRRASVRDML